MTETNEKNDIAQYATRWEMEEYVIEHRGHDRYSIGTLVQGNNSGSVYFKDEEAFCYESLPSNRSDEDLENTRFTLKNAIIAVQSWIVADLHFQEWLLANPIEGQLQFSELMDQYAQVPYNVMTQQFKNRMEYFLFRQWWDKTGVHMVEDRCTESSEIERNPTVIPNDATEWTCPYCGNVYQMKKQ